MIKICQQCGVEFKSGKKQKFCSQQCVSKVQAQKSHEEAVKRNTKVCQYCKKNFVQRRPSDNAKFCSVECHSLSRVIGLEEKKRRREAYYEANKEHIIARRKAWRETNKEVRSVKFKVYYEANKERIKTTRMLYCNNNKDKITNRRKVYNETHKKEKALRDKIYRESNRSKRRAILQRYKSRKYNASVVECFLDSEIFLRDGFVCQYCGSQLNNLLKPTIDHVTPLSRGGTHTKDNCVTSCQSCNSSKCDKLLAEWSFLNR